MSPQLNNLIDEAMARRVSLVSDLIGAHTDGRYIEALAIEGVIAKLDVLLRALARATTVH